MSEEGKLATQTEDWKYSLTHTGEELTEGRHYWEVEIAGQAGGTYIGVCRPDADPSAAARALEARARSFGLYVVV